MGVHLGVKASPGPIRPVTERGERTRDAILAAAIERFARDGFRATSVTDIAGDAGVSDSAPYTYFADKEDLFFKAVDHDVASLIEEGLASVVDTTDIAKWRDVLLAVSIGALGSHPLARRILAGREPEVTGRLLDLPALASLRAAIHHRLRAEQSAGRVRSSLDVELVADGMVTITLSLLMSLVQVGIASTVALAPGVMAVFDAALGVETVAT